MPYSLSDIIRVDLTESLSSALNSVLEILVDSREIDRSDRRSEGRLNGFPAVKGEKRKESAAMDGFRQEPVKLTSA